MGGKFKFKPKKLKVQNWQLILILIPLLFLSASLLRFDHVHMVELRDAVLEADEKGDMGELSAALEELSSFTQKNIIVNIVDKNGTSEIVFGTEPFSLENSYKRDAEAALEKAEKTLTDGSNPNGNIFSAAMNVCKPIAIRNGWYWNSPGYIECMTGEINKYPSSENLTDQITAMVPSTKLYRVEFSSPIWAPSASGFVILACIILTVVIFIRILIWIIIRLSLLFI